MIQVNDAAKIAQDTLTTFYPRAQNIQLEEVELDEMSTHWLITLSFIDPEAMLFPTFPKPRNYKLFRIASDTGEMVSMKIRELK